MIVSITNERHISYVAFIHNAKLRIDARLENGEWAVRGHGEVRRSNWLNS